MLHHGGIQIPPTGNAARQPATKPIMAFNSAGHILALQQSREPGRRSRPAIAPRGIIATGLTTGGRRYAGKPDDPIAKTERFTIENANLRGLGRDGPIRRGRTE